MNGWMELSSTRLTCFALIGCTLFNWVSCIADRRRQLSCIGEDVYNDATQLDVELSCVGEVSIATRRRNSIQLDVELSCVAINGWRKRDHSLVVAAISQWRCRIAAFVRAHSGHFEHIL